MVLSEPLRRRIISSSLLTFALFTSSSRRGAAGAAGTGGGVTGSGLEPKHMSVSFISGRGIEQEVFPLAPVSLQNAFARKPHALKPLVRHVMVDDRPHFQAMKAARLEFRDEFIQGKARNRRDGS